MQCKTCSIEISEFNKCCKAKQCLSCYSSYLKEYRSKNPDKVRKYRDTDRPKAKEAMRARRATQEGLIASRKAASKWYASNKLRASASQKAYKEKNKDQIQKYISDWHMNNRKHMQEYYRKKRKSDINYRLADNLRARVRHIISGDAKSGSSVEDLGCSIKQLKQHLESKFKPGMTWGNYGFRGWHIDHIVPLSKFDLTDREQFLQACHYTNLQPLWWQDNLKKSNKCLSSKWPRNWKPRRNNIAWVINSYSAGSRLSSASSR